MRKSAAAPTTKKPLNQRSVEVLADGSVRFEDDEVGRLLVEAEKHGLDSATAIAFCSYWSPGQIETTLLEWLPRRKAFKSIRLLLMRTARELKSLAALVPIQTVSEPPFVVVTRDELDAIQPALRTVCARLEIAERAFKPGPKRSRHRPSNARKNLFIAEWERLALKTTGRPLNSLGAKFYSVTFGERLDPDSYIRQRRRVKRTASH